MRLSLLCLVASLIAACLSQATASDIRQKLAKARPITTRKPFGPAPNVTLRPMVTYIPNKRSWNLYLTFAPSYVSWGKTLTYNIDEKKPDITTFGFTPPYARRNKAYTPGEYEYCVRLGTKRFVYPDKMVLPLQTKYKSYHGDIILTYDIATNNMVHKVELPKSFRMLVADANDAGIIRGSGRTENGSHFQCFEYNPHTTKLTMSSTFRAGIGGFSDYSYGMTSAVKDWIVFGMGANPWQLVGYNFKTSKWKLLKTVQGKGSYRTFYVSEQIGETIYIPSRDQSGNDTYWLFDNGKLSKLSGPIKNTRNMHPLQAKYPYLGAMSQQLWIDPKIKMNDLTLPPPKVDVDSSIPGQDNKLNVSYTYKGKSHTDTFAMKPFKGGYALIGSSGDYIFGAAGNYGEHIFYNRKTGKHHVFSGAGNSVYSMKAIGKKVYVAGYPNFRLFEYDLNTMTQTDVGHFEKEVQSHRPFAGIEKGIDGKVYIAGRYYRTRNGGGLAIYDPKTKTKSGVIINRYNPYWMAAIRKGRYMVMSCKEDGGILAIYDVQKQALNMSKIEGLFPGAIIGVGKYVVGYGKNESGNIIYKLDPISKKMAWKIAVPEPPVTAVSPVRQNQYIKAYDGRKYVYFNVGNCLAKVHVDNGSLTVLGKLSSTASIHITKKGEVFQAGAVGFAQLRLP